MGSCCCNNPPKPEPAKTSCCSSASENADGDAGFWWRLPVCLVLFGAMMMVVFGLSAGSDAGQPITAGDSSYWQIHGALIAGAVISFLLLGLPMLREAVTQWMHFNVTIESLFLSSAIGAFVGSLAVSIQGTGGDIYYDTVVVVMIIYAVGKYVGRFSREKALAAAARLRDAFDAAFVRDAGSGERLKKPLSEIRAGDVVSVAPGEGIPVDGVIVSGRGYVQEAAMTGEPLPAVRGEGDAVHAGTFSQDGTFLIRVSASKGARGLDAVLAAVENSRRESSRVQAQADRLMRWFFPLVLLVAGATFAWWWYVAGVMKALFHAMAVLLVACPCALGLATPIAIWSALYRLSRLGLVSKKADLLENLARVDRMVFDKTGTLSHEELKVSGFIVSKNWIQKENELRDLIAAAQANQSHPVAAAFQKFFKTKAGITAEITQIPGAGIEAHASGGEFLRLGEAALFSPEIRAEFEALAATLPAAESDARRVFVSVNDAAAGVVLLREDLRDAAGETVEALGRMGIRAAILTGDARPRWREIAGAEVIFGLSPLEKEARVRAWRDAGERVVFAGDGINDAAAMTQANGSIAMGTGTDLAQAAADGVLVGNSLAALPAAVGLARKVFRVLRGNLYYAVGYNLIGMGLAAVGLLTPVYAALIMMISSAWVSWRAVQATRIEN